MKNTRNEVLNDYRIANESRQASLLGRREVLDRERLNLEYSETEKKLLRLHWLKFSGTEISVRDITATRLLLLLRECPTLKQFFAQLYADTDIEREPCSGGRSMNCHFATSLLDETGNGRI